MKLPFERTCDCPPTHINCLTPGEWLSAQVGVWRFGYEQRDVRDKKVHPATYPIALARKCIQLFTHRGELVCDPFVGSGTTLLAARECGRNAVGADLNPAYVQLARERLAKVPRTGTRQVCVVRDARDLHRDLEPARTALILTSPPYANCLNRSRRNKSRRSEDRRNEQFGRVEQYSQAEGDLGLLCYEAYVEELGSIFGSLRRALRHHGHCVVNVPDIWWEDERIPLHVGVIEALTGAGYELRNIVIWDKTNLVNRMGIFGWPSNYITMGVTFEYLLHFRRPAADSDEVRERA